MPEPDRRKGTLHPGVVQQLRHLIVTGVLAPGARLNERELCERLAVSRTPVREAIKTLIRDGLLNALPNRSAVVAPLDAEEIKALIEVVPVIEGLAGELATRNVTAAALAEMRLLQARMHDHRERGELPGYFALNLAFHRKIVVLSANPVLLWTWDLLALKVDRARYASNLRPERWRAAIEEHENILEALSAGDPERVGKVLRAHIRNGMESLLLTLTRRDSGSGAGRSPPEGPA